MNSHCILQLNPSIPVVTPDGKGEAIGWMDYGKEDDLLWIVFLRMNGECWIYSNPQIRACPNITFGRMPETSTAELAKSIDVRHLPRSRRTGKKPRFPKPIAPSPLRHARNGFTH
jgi:hypothetical protein